MPSRTQVLLISSGRKGTWLLLSTLRRHGDVYCFDQILDVPKPNLHESGPAAFDRTLGRSFSPEVPLTIPVLLPVRWVACRTAYPGFWEYARGFPLSIIHLHRQNMLRWYVSTQVVEKTKRWAKWADNPVPIPAETITLDIEACQAAILGDLQGELDAQRFFQNHRSLHLWYEDLCRDFPAQLQRVWSFLGLAYRDRQPLCHKQETRPLREVITNYDELVGRWQGTPWEQYLVETPDPEVPPAKSRAAAGHNL